MPPKLMTKDARDARAAREQQVEQLTRKLMTGLEQHVKQTARNLLTEAMEDEFMADVVIVDDDDEWPSDEGQQGRLGDPTGEPFRAASESKSKVNGNRTEDQGIYNPVLPPGVNSVLEWSTTKVTFGKRHVGKSYQQAYDIDKTENFEWATYLKLNSSAISIDYLNWLQEVHSNWTDDTDCFIPGTSIRRTFVN